MSLCRYVAFVQFAIYQPLMSVFLVFESVIVSLSISYLVPFTPACIIFCLSTSYSLYYFHLACIFFCIACIVFLKKIHACCFHPHPLRTQLLFIFRFVVIIVSSFLISRANGVHAQKTVTPFNSGITVLLYLLVSR